MRPNFGSITSNPGSSIFRYRNASTISLVKVLGHRVVTKGTCQGPLRRRKPRSLVSSDKGGFSRLEAGVRARRSVGQHRVAGTPTRWPAGGHRTW